MMPSAIPARLQFQCGHAALVTLPRVKGETATQRSDRVAREKQSALSRQCDFCAPVHVELADGLDLALEKGTPVEELAVIVAAEPEPAVVAEAVAVEELQEESVAALAEESPEIVAEEPVVVADEPEVVVDEQPTVAPEPEPSVLEPVLEKVNGANGTNGTNGTNGVAAAKPTRKPRARRQPADMVARGRRFLVEYRLERVLRADSIHEALRQVATYGAGEVVAITRED
jgi:hypothetical protein